MSTLFNEALQVAIRQKRSTWQVETYLIQAPISAQTFIKTINKQCFDVVLMETTNQYFTLMIESLKKIENENVHIMLLVDSMVGEVYHHLKDKERLVGVTKNTSLTELLTLLESFKSNISHIPKVSLTDIDKNILRILAMGHTFEYIQRTQGLSVDEINQSLYRINTYFSTANYIESISKAFEQKVIAY